MKRTDCVRIHFECDWTQFQNVVTQWEDKEKEMVIMSLSTLLRLSVAGCESNDLSRQTIVDGRLKRFDWQLFICIIVTAHDFIDRFSFIMNAFNTIAWYDLTECEFHVQFDQQFFISRCFHQNIGLCSRTQSMWI